MRYRFGLTAIACVLTLSSTQVSGQQDRLDDGGTPLRYFELEDANKAMSDPDAMGEFDIPDPSGFDLTTPWPGKETKGWKARIEIKAHVPVKENRFTTLTRISYVPPESVNVTSNASLSFAKMDQTWYPCSHLWVSSDLKASAGDVKASCSGTVPDKCTSDILESLQGSFDGRFNLGWKGSHCPFTTLPDTCRSALGNRTRLIDYAPNRNSDSDIFILSPWYYFEDTDVHEKDDDSWYQAALNRVWILGTAWGYSRLSTFANGTNPNINATITCLRANEKVSSGSNGKGGNGGNGGKDSDNGATSLKTSYIPGLTASVVVGLGLLVI